MPRHPPKPINAPNGSSIYYQGTDLKRENRRSVIYFALSGEKTLYEDPFNQPVLRLADENIPVFSWDLPYHSPGQDPHEAMRQWTDEWEKGSPFISDFMELCLENINYLIDQELIDSKHIAVAGLSRGGYMAIQLAARDDRIRSIVGFAPLTSPHRFIDKDSSRPDDTSSAQLTSLAGLLIKKNVCFYIGNRDTRVGTDACYSFVHALTEAAFSSGIRSPSVELTLYPSIGFQGHGTPPSIFRTGADWIKQHLMA